MEAFHPLQLGYQSEGPKAQAMLCSADMVRDDLNQLLAPTFEELMA